MALLQVVVVVEAMSQRRNELSGVEFAWRVHSALDTWTGKVDTKASIALAIEVAVLGFVITLSEEDRPLAGLSGGDLNLYNIGLVFLVLSVLLSMFVVAPQLSRWKTRQNWRSNMIYFGHLRFWKPRELAKALSTEQPYEEQLAQQLVQMSKIAWRKHSLLQGSLICLVVGAVLLLLAGA